VYEPTGRLTTLWKGPVGAYGEPMRQTAWWDFMKLYEEHGVDVLYDAADVFIRVPWSSGFGGLSWGTAARMTADYLTGSISRRVFIDRCWTLQHNGGCIFNKYWDVTALTFALQVQSATSTKQAMKMAKLGPTKRRFFKDSGVDALSPYDILAEGYASAVVYDMWKEYHRRNRRDDMLVRWIQRATKREEVAV
jgi:hypothetical protein